ncbi:hypothetical protein [uncultured Pontibacter sp.]|uniref:hypothetical protein n=1 Tax=uncultured Pontibacter sp. TaxID=453356 RepID=UPI002613F81F|nr:hypothetical protein [uncultured Pontibacter sp.]
MTAEQFREKYTEALDTILEAMAENAEVDPEKFYSMACVLENLRYFSPVLYGAIKKKAE